MVRVALHIFQSWALTKIAHLFCDFSLYTSLVCYPSVILRRLVISFNFSSLFCFALCFVAWTRWLPSRLPHPTRSSSKTYTCSCCPSFGVCRQTRAPECTRTPPAGRFAGVASDKEALLTEESGREGKDGGASRKSPASFVRALGRRVCGLLLWRSTTRRKNGLGRHVHMRFHPAILCAMAGWCGWIHIYGDNGSL